MKGLKNMKKTLPIILALTMVCCSFTACGDKDKNGDERATDEISATDENIMNDDKNTNDTEADTHDNGVVGDIVTDAESLVDDLVSRGEEMVDDAGSVIDGEADSTEATSN
jgi:hypothetical protein